MPCAEMPAADKTSVLQMCLKESRLFSETPEIVQAKTCFAHLMKHLGMSDTDVPEAFTNVPVHAAIKLLLGVCAIRTKMPRSPVSVMGDCEGSAIFILSHTFSLTQEAPTNMDTATWRALIRKMPSDVLSTLLSLFVGPLLTASAEANPFASWDGFQARSHQVAAEFKAEFPEFSKILISTTSDSGGVFASVAGQVAPEGMLPSSVHQLQAEYHTRLQVLLLQRDFAGAAKLQAEAAEHGVHI